MNDALQRMRLLVVMILLALGLPALAGSPSVSGVYPVAGQRGQSVDIVMYGARLDDATRVLFHTTGISAGEVLYEKNRVKATLTIAPDAPIGEHQIRLMTKSGVSEMATFYVLDRPIVKEKADKKDKDSNRFTQSTSFDEPQEIEMGTTILGRTEAEDIDYYAVDLKKGQRLSVQIDGMRLGRGFTDSYLAVLNAERFEVAVSDDTALLRQDPYVTLVAPEAGRYVIVVRDSGYEGSNNNRYLLHVGAFPRPAVVFPLGGKPGEQATLRFIGDPVGNIEQTIKLPVKPNNDYAVTPVYQGKSAPSGHAFRVNGLPNVLEAQGEKNNTMALAKPGQTYGVPVAFNGIIETPGDMDYFKIELKKGQDVTVRCFASSMGSPLDSVVNAFHVEGGKHITGNDDQPTSADSMVTFKAPEDGAYYVRVYDHRKRGGPEFVYRLEATVAAPSLTTYIHRYDRNRPQSRQAIAVPRGNRYAALVRVRRSRVGGDLTPVIDGLPGGVTFDGLGPAEKGDMMPVVFEASADAPLGASMVELLAQSAPRGDSADRITSRFNQVTPIVMANPNRTEYYNSTLRTMPVAVTDAVPFKIDVVPPKAPLVRDGKLKLKLKVTREGYDGRVRMYMLWRPTGVGATSMVEFLNGKTEGVFEVDANTAAGLRDWPMVVYGYADVPGGPVWTSSELFYLKIEEPFVTGKIAKAKCTQGESVQITVKLEHPRAWTGEGELKLLGLPAGCKVEPLTIKPGQKEAVIQVQTAEKTPPGQHKSLMAELTIMVNGEPVIHRVGRGGQLRIDKPRTERTAQTRIKSNKAGE